jgi:hypothetical protein
VFLRCTNLPRLEHFIYRPRSQDLYPTDDAQLILAYDAIRASATAALRAVGSRGVRGRGGEHYRTIQALEYSIDPERNLIPKLDTLRRKRNTGTYDDYGLVPRGEADLAGQLVGRVRGKVENSIRRDHANKIGYIRAIPAVRVQSSSKSAQADFAPIDGFLGALYIHFSNDLSTAKLPESKYAAFHQWAASCCPAGVGSWRLALCWSRSYGRLVLRNGCNLMEHPFEDAVMDRV